VLKTILEAGAAYPLLRELMSFAHVDKSKLSDTAKNALGSLGAELTSALKPNAQNGEEEIPILEPEIAPVTHRGRMKVSHVDPAE